MAASRSPGNVMFLSSLAMSPEKPGGNLATFRLAGDRLERRAGGDGRDLTGFLEEPLLVVRGMALVEQPAALLGIGVERQRAGMPEGADGVERIFLDDFDVLGVRSRISPPGKPRTRAAQPSRQGAAD